MTRILHLHGRQSSHYTRVARMFAHELGVAVEFVPITDLMSLDAADFVGNPALKLPILRVGADAVFGSTNICRVLAREAGAEADVFWPEQADCPLLMNAHELVTHAMAAQVEVVMHEVVAKRPLDLVSRKRRQGLIASLEWLGAHLDAVLDQLPPRRLSLFEVQLFCLLAHLPFRNPIDLSAMPMLAAFERRIGARPAARATPYRFDAAPPEQTRPPP